MATCSIHLKIKWWVKSLILLSIVFPPSSKAIDSFVKKHGFMMETKFK